MQDVPARRQRGEQVCLHSENHLSVFKYPALAQVVTSHKHFALNISLSLFFFSCAGQGCTEMSRLKTEHKGLNKLTKSVNFISTQGERIISVLTYCCRLN